MLSRILVSLSAASLLAGCSALPVSADRADYFETQYRAAQALQGEDAAFERLGELRQRWDSRADCRLPWRADSRRRAGQISVQVAQIVDAGESITAQKDVVELMINALRDIESEYDAILGILQDGDAPVADRQLAAGQRYLARRMLHSLALLSGADMASAAEASDLFGRDVALFGRQLAAAINGDEELGLEAASDPEITGSLTQVEELFEEYVQSATEDLLDQVVFRFSAWSALQALSALEHGVPAAAATATGRGAADDEPDGDDALADDAVADEAADEAAAEDEAVDDGDEAAY